MKLIDGVYTAKQAQAVLLPLIRHKIQYHELAIFSNDVKDIDRNAFHKKRLEELFNLRETVKEEIDFAEKTGLLLTVKCELNISLESGSPIEDENNMSNQKRSLILDWLQKNALVCTMHGKETVIEPVLASLGFNWLSASLNTDQFGTFTGEIERKDSPIEAATKKCQLAFKRTEASVAIASEGSFGPHPSIPFIPVNEEILLFWDKESNIKVTVSSISTATNFSSKMCASFDELLSFAHKVGFPDHRLILRNENGRIIYKGITDAELLLKRFNQLSKLNQLVWVETDMRAHFNPTRMKHIESLAEKLKSKLISLCPKCETPGFGKESYESGLPCSQCGLPTSSVKLKKIECTKCSYSTSISYPNSKKFEDPQFCSFCNP